MLLSFFPIAFLSLFVVHADYSSQRCAQQKNLFIKKLKCSEQSKFVSSPSGKSLVTSYDKCANDAQLQATVSGAHAFAQGYVSEHSICTIEEVRNKNFVKSEHLNFPAKGSRRERHVDRIFSADSMGCKLHLKSFSGDVVDCTSPQIFDLENKQNIKWQECVYKKKKIPALRADQLSAIYDGRFTVAEALKLPAPYIQEFCDPKHMEDCPKPNISIPTEK